MRSKESTALKSDGNLMLSSECPTTREKMISEAAYFIAEARGFGADRELDDWLQAEAAFDRDHSKKASHQMHA